jgi:hypothetical protein
MEQLKNGSLEEEIFRNIDRLYPKACDTHGDRNPSTTCSVKSWAIAIMPSIGATKRGFRRAECSASAEKSLLTGPKTAKKFSKKRSRNVRETLQKRFRYRPALRLDALNQQ